MQCGTARPFTKCGCAPAAGTQDRTGDLQIFGLTLSQLSYRGLEMQQHIWGSSYNAQNKDISLDLFYP